MPPTNPSRKNQYNHVPGRGEGNMGIIGSNHPALARGNKNLGRSQNYGYIDNTTNDSERFLQYPLDLGNDASHYIVFHIYQSSGGVELKDETWFKEQEDDYRHSSDQFETFSTESVKRAEAAQLFGQFGATSMQNLYTKTSQIASNNASSQVIRMNDIQRTIDNQDLAEQNRRRYNSAAWQGSIAKSNTRLNEPAVRSKDTIAMYMPSKINSMNMLDYEMEGFETVQQGREAFDQAFSEGQGTFMERVLKSGSAFGALAGTKAMQLVGDMSQTVGMGDPMNILKAYGRVAINPQKEQLFNAPAPRKYEFAFEFAPRNEEESIVVRNIVQLFKYHAFPSIQSAKIDFDEGAGAGLKNLAGAAFYDMPSEFQFEYRHIDRREGNEISVENHYLNRAERCVLSEINVDYSGAGAFQTFDNGAPTHITLTLTFSEVRLITREHIDRGY